MHSLHLFEVFGARGHDIDARGINARMPQNVRQLGNVLFHAVKDARKQVPQIVRKHLAWQHARLLAQRFHHPPHAGAADRLAVPCKENAPFCDLLRFCVPCQLFLQRRNDQNAPILALAVHGCLSPPRRLYGNILQLADAYARAADGLEDQTQPLVLALACRADKTAVFVARQLLLLLAEHLPLHRESLDGKLPCPQKRKNTFSAASMEFALETA